MRGGRSGAAAKPRAAELRRLPLMRVLLALCLLTGCAMSETPPTDPTPIPGIDEPLPLDPVDALLLGGELPNPEDPAAFEPRYGPETRLSATYRIEPTAGGKKLQSVLLMGDDGRVYVRAYRPLPDEYRFADKRVVVTGRPYVNSPYVQSVQGLHFEVSRIELAPGELPREPAPTQLPAPPLARSAQAAQAAGSWYLCCVGRVEGGTFHFVDGGSLPLSPGDARPGLRLEGAPITLLAEMNGGALRPVDACPGIEPRCGIQEPG